MQRLFRSGCDQRGNGYRRSSEFPFSFHFFRDLLLIYRFSDNLVLLIDIFFFLFVIGLFLIPLPLLIIVEPFAALLIEQRITLSEL